MSEMIATRDAYGKVLVELGREDSRIVALDADLSGSTKTGLFAKEFPERFFNAGIAEANMVGMAAGLAAGGMIPFASTFAVFAAGRAFEQVRQSLAYPKMNVKLVATHGGITVGEDGGSHQSVEDLAIMRVLPNMTVLCPADGPETAAAIRAVAAWRGPVYVRLGRSKVPTVFTGGCDFVIGKGATLRPGSDLTFVTTGLMTAQALDAARILAEEKISARVLHLGTIKPLDVDLLLTAARETGAIVTAEEHSVIGGLGGAVCETLAEGYPVPVERVGLRDLFGQSGTAEELLVHYGLTPAHLVEAAERVLQRKR
ncbi:transketolase family protein [Desulfuromonas carbonis]|uniref:transketolase family protein n=1 Tax=Desulfuromonas sp. DDH964 TaxID=1823759 RepID=UPI00078D9ECC|nr:transketolase family protein [Desulfuromonas sp. DDH964]AMV73362.1 transketolase, B protein [Desulfuromonas sp. DDH964]